MSYTSRHPQSAHQSSPTKAFVQTAEDSPPSAENPLQPSSNSLSDEPRITPLAFRNPGDGPLSFFNSKCANCHGSYGSKYLEEEVISLSALELHDQVVAMVEGIAKVELPEREMRALTAFSATIPGIYAGPAPSGGPFIAWVGWSDSDKHPDHATPINISSTATPTSNFLRGEVTPGSTVVVQIGPSRIQASVQGHFWAAQITPELLLQTNILTSPITITAQLLGKSATFTLGDEPFAIPAPTPRRNPTPLYNPTHSLPANPP